MSLAHLLFVASIFLSAFLLFLVQPLATRLLLPAYGGSPAVWNTALVFFQTTLLAGYLYAHFLSRRVSPRGQVIAHGLVLVLPLLLLPPSVPAELGATVASAGWPAASLLTTLAVLVGVPFFALSTNASLIQYWWSRSGFPGSHDPYWLYGASNLGSLLALLSYPFVLEPALGVTRQSVAWAVGYGVFAVLTFSAALRASRATRRGAESAAVRGDAQTDLDAAARAGPVTTHRKLLWVARSAVGSSLLLAVTMQITTDLAPAPLLWVIPLALYLTTFILAFSFTDRLPRRPLAGATVVAVSASVGLLLVRGQYPFEVMLALALATLFFGALLCHRDLAADRPSTDELTGFYLWISFGGALGGALNALLAPVLFDSVAELPLTLMALSVLFYFAPAAGTLLTPYRPSWRVGTLSAIALMTPMFVALRNAEIATAAVVLVLGLGVVWGVATARYVGLVAVSVWLLCALLLAGFTDADSMVARERSFFGVVRILDFPDAVEMIHGTTVHGRQFHDPELSRLPITYYYPDGPLGSLVAQAPEGARIGVIGLGTGALAAAASRGQEVVFYEIDPVVVRLAQQHFTYLDDSAGEVRLVLGDGRLALEKEPDASFDVFIVDAFSSDFVPTHLLTEEALQLYLDKVRPGGIVGLHISNRHADLRRVVRGFGETTGTSVLFSEYSPTAEARERGAVRTLAAALPTDTATLERLAGSPLWTRFAADVPAVHWTDDHADLLSVLR
jgi:SAM-dependent methyltransferase